MTKEELIITEKYDKYQENEIDNLYINLYSSKVNDPIKSKLMVLFSYYHYELNSLLAELNYRIQGSKYYRADDSRFLIVIIDDVFELISVLKNTKYDFSLERTYYFYLKNAKIYLKSSGGTQVPEDVKPISIKKYDKIFNLIKDDNSYIDISQNVDDVLKVVSSRNATFIEMEIDEKLASINMAIENILVKNQKYISVDSDLLFLGFISEEQIKEYRKLTHCFRHGSSEMVEKRAQFTENQKVFLVNYGLTICTALIQN